MHTGFSDRNSDPKLCVVSIANNGVPIFFVEKCENVCAKASHIFNKKYQLFAL